MFPASLNASFVRNPLSRQLFMAFLLGLAHCLPLSNQALAKTPTLPRKASGRQVALLIGVEQYKNVPPLMFVRNDVQRLGVILRERGGFDDVVELSDGATDEKKWPIKETIMSTVSKWLQSRAKDDTVVVYFSGHGFRDAEGVMYLAPLDADPVNLAGTGVPVAWFRDQIARCKASLKLLVLDACHAGSTKGSGSETNFGTQDLEMFEKLEGVVTLASSTAEQPSQMWDEKQQSLFSYWLNQGLKGHADEDGNGEVNIDELYKYLHRNVTQTAQSRFHRPQTPVRKIGLGTPGLPVVVYTRPQTLKQLLTDMAQQLGDAIADRKLARVGVLEFTNNSKLGEMLGADYGLLGQECSVELEKQLIQEQRDRYKVVNRRKLRQALQQQKFTLADLGSGEALKALASKAGGMPAIAQGTLHHREGAMVSLRCELIETDTNDVLASVGGNAWLNENEFASLGKSFEVRPGDRMPELASTGRPTQPIEDVVIDRVEQRAEGPHPLQNPNFPFRVWIQVDGKERKGEFRGNDYFVPLRKGEVYEIWIENRSGQLSMMRLLVDGLNTLIQKDSPTPTQVGSEEEVQTASAPSTQHEKGLITEIFGKPVSLDQARAWVLNPDDPARKLQKNKNLYRVVGFVTKVGVEGEMAKFTIVDTEKSLAGRQKFMSQIGIITAAFYNASASRGATAAGEKVKVKLEVEKADIGSLIGVINIRYYDPDEPPTSAK